MKASPFVLLSGGPDSAAAAFSLKAQRLAFRALFIDYGQPTRRPEMTAAQRLVRKLGVRLTILPMVALYGAFARLSPSGIETDASRRKARQAGPYPHVLMAASYAAAAGASSIVIGVHGDDEVHFPGTFKALRLQEETMRTGVDAAAGRFAFEMPFEARSKADVIGLAAELDVPLELTWSCHVVRGEHCGKCIGCERRKNAFKAAVIWDSTTYDVPRRIRRTLGPPVKVRRRLQTEG